MNGLLPGSFDFAEQSAISATCASCHHHRDAHRPWEGCTCCGCARFVGDRRESEPRPATSPATTVRGRG